VRVVYDLRGAQTPYFPERGIPRYVTHHAAALLERPEIERMVGLVHADRPLPPVATRLAGSGGLASPEGLAAGAAGDGPLIHHIGSPFELDIPHRDLLPPALSRPDVLRAATLFDVIPLVAPDAHAPWIMRRWRARAAVLATCDLLLALSEYSAEDGIRRLGLDERRVRVIGTGVPAVDESALADRGEPPRLPGLEPPFVLYTGGTEHWRKNLPALIRAYALLDEDLRARHQLVIASRVNPGHRAELEAHARAAGVADRVLLTGYVTDQVLRRLYLSCACFVYPSLYEGFGLPVAEAMSHGAPAVTSSTTACGEIVTDPRAAFDPTDDRDIAAAIARVLRDPAFAEELRRAGRRRAAELRWEPVAERTVAAYEEALARRRTAPAPRTPAPALAFATFAFPEVGSPAASLLSVAAAASVGARVLFSSPAPLRPRAPGFAARPTGRMAGALRWTTAPLVCLVDGPDSVEPAVELLDDRPVTLVLWELDRLLGPPGRPVVGAPEGLLRLLARAERVVVAGELDAARVRLLAGSAAPQIAVLAPPLAWTASAGSLGQELPMDATAMLNPGRAALRALRPLPLLVAPRPDRLGPFAAAEIERAGALAVGLARTARPARVALVGDVDGDALEAAAAACAAAGAPGRLGWAPWPGLEECLAWSTAAEAFIDLGGGGPSASEAAIDQALRARRPIAALSLVGERAPAVRRLGAEATPAELVAAVAGLLAEGAPFDDDGALERRSPAAVAGRLLALVRGARAPG
jgi:glycosyltransferase involved in cell wall biosynthesis